MACLSGMPFFCRNQLKRLKRLVNRAGFLRRASNHGKKGVILMQLEERDWLIALDAVKGAGWQTIHRLVQATASLKELSEWSLEQFQAIGIRRKTAEALQQAMAESWVLLQKKRRASWPYRVLTVFDAHYPELLRQIHQPPWVLYAMGRLDLLQGPCISMVGTRTPTSYGRMVAYKLARELAEHGWVVVSGMARGIDSEAHKGALQSQGGTIAVLGCGIDQIYPPENKWLYEEIAQKGLVLSEYPPGTPVHAGLFPQRNRLISGLSLGTVVVEAASRSGALITADFALEQSREVFAVPGPIYNVQSSGTNQLIKEGAKMVTGVHDILEEYAFAGKPSSASHAARLTAEENRLLSHIGYAGVHIDELKKITGQEWATLYPMLMQLQVKKVIRQLPGSYYIRCD